MKSDWVTATVVALVLILTGLVTDRQIRPAWRQIRAAEPALNLAEVDDGVGQGLALGLLGGFRALAADLLWLRMNSAWERRDLAQTESFIRLALAVDPRPFYFWINGARIIAYDMPVWRIEAIEATGRRVSGVVRDRIVREHAKLALELLAKREAVDRENPWLAIEIANIHLWRLNDVEAAARYYRRAAELPRAPYFAARIHGELLKRLGRDREALEWLRSVHATLPKDDPDAMADVVLERIRALEDKLGVPVEARYRPPGRLAAPGRG